MPDSVLTWDQYADRWAALHGGVDPRHGRREVRWFARFAYHVGRVLVRLRVPPGAVTAAGLLLAIGAPVLAVRHGSWPGWAALLVLASGAFDGLDGAVAVVGARTSPLGHVYDSLADRLAELSWLIALWLVGVPGWLATLCLILSWLHEYTQARAAGAGMSGIGAVTLAERPTRIVFATLALAGAALGELFNHDVSVGTATMVAGLWALIGFVGLVQLVVAVVKTLRKGVPEDTLSVMPTQDLATSEAETLSLLREPENHP